MKLEVGMYVRFVTGFDVKTDKPIVRIGKIENINDYCITINVFSRQIIVSLKEFEELNRKKPSHNKIDLIEVGDYVNGYKVYEIKENCVMVGYKCFVTKFNDEEEFLYQTIYEEDIKSIVTSEQFSQMEYKVGE